MLLPDSTGGEARQPAPVIPVCIEAALEDSSVLVAHPGTERRLRGRRRFEAAVRAGVHRGLLFRRRCSTGRESAPASGAPAPWAANRLLTRTARASPADELPV